MLNVKYVGPWDWAEPVGLLRNTEINFAQQRLKIR